MLYFKKYWGEKISKISEACQIRHQCRTCLLSYLSPESSSILQNFRGLETVYVKYYLPCHWEKGLAKEGVYLQNAQIDTVK